MVAQFPEFEISFFPALLGIVQKKGKKPLVTDPSIQYVEVLAIFLLSSFEYFQPGAAFLSTRFFSAVGSYASTFLSFIPILWGRLSWVLRSLTYLLVFPTYTVSNSARYKDLLYPFPSGVRYLYFLMNSLVLVCEVSWLDKANEQILDLQKLMNNKRNILHLRIPHLKISTSFKVFHVFCACFLSTNHTFPPKLTGSPWNSLILWL